MSEITLERVYLETTVHVHKRSNLALFLTNLEVNAS